jgi:hypothetical protein
VLSFKLESSRRIILLLSLLVLGGCAETIPVTLPFETFLTLTDSTYLTRSEAIVRVAGADCGEMGALVVLGDAAGSADQAMNNAALKLDSELFRTGANAYVIDGYRWLESPNRASAMQLELSVRSFICSA